MSFFKNIIPRINFQIGRMNLRCLSYSKVGYKKIWVIGYGRSGTTWLSELINFTGDYSFLFEPFHGLVLKENADRIVNNYIRSGKNDPGMKKLVNSVFSHEFYHKRLYQNKLKFTYKGILVKDIFANLMAKWVKNNFPEIKIVLIMRHPFAVAVSRQNVKDWIWINEPDYFFGQQDLYEDYLSEFREELDSVKSPFEKLILNWSIVHYVTLKELNEEDCKIVFYENLASNPFEEFKEIFNYLEIDFSSNDYDCFKAGINKPSKVTTEESAVRKKGNLIDTWSQTLTEDEIRRGLRILRRFSLDKIYGEELMPNVEGLKEF